MAEEVIIKIRIKDTVFEKRVLVDLEEAMEIGEALDRLYQHRIVNAWEMKEAEEGHYIFFPR